MWELQLTDIRPSGQIRPFGSALWFVIFGRPVFIYSAVRIRSYGPVSFGMLILVKTIPFWRGMHGCHSKKRRKSSSFRHIFGALVSAFELRPSSLEFRYLWYEVDLCCQICVYRARISHRFLAVIDRRFSCRCRVDLS